MFFQKIHISINLNQRCVLMAKKSMSSSESTAKESLYTPIGAIVALLLITLIAVYSGGSGSSTNGATGLAIGMTCAADADCGSAKEICYESVCINKAWKSKLDKYSAEKKQKALLMFKQKYEKSQPKNASSQPIPPPSEPTPAPQPTEPTPVEPTKQCVLDLKYDLTGDGYVGNKDLNFMKGILFKQKTCPAEKTCDVNGDGKVNTADLQGFLNANKACIDAATADPSLEKSVCGDNVLDTGEVCDGTIVPASLKTCPPETKGPVITSCKTDCSGPDTSACVAQPKCTTLTSGYTMYGSLNCGYGSGSCNDDLAKGTVGCCTEKLLSSACSGNMLTNQTINSCTGKSTTNQLDCSTQKIWYYNGKWNNEPVPGKCEMVNGLAQCVGNPQACKSEIVETSKCDGDFMLNVTKNTCTGALVTNKVNCKETHSWMPHTCGYSEAWKSIKCAPTTEVATVQCSIKPSGSTFYGNKWCGSSSQYCNDNSAKGTVGCCNVTLVPDSAYCEANLLVNQTISSCTGEKTTNKKDCSVDFEPKVCGAINDKYDCYKTCTEKGLPLGSGAKVIFNSTQGVFNSTYGNVGGVAFLKYNYYCSLEGLKTDWTQVFADTSGKLCDKDVKFNGCVFENSWNGQTYFNAYAYTISCSDSGKAYITESSKWCGTTMKSCNPSTGLCVK